jgi:hypothetical protein
METVTMSYEELDISIWVLHRTVVFRAFCQEVEEDIPIWSRKAYLSSPALAIGDGPITSYRRWASQFHPSERATEEPLRVPPAR